MISEARFEVSREIYRTAQELVRNDPELTAEYEAVSATASQFDDYRFHVERNGTAVYYYRGPVEAVNRIKQWNMKIIMLANERLNVRQAQ